MSDKGTNNWSNEINQDKLQMKIDALSKTCEEILERLETLSKNVETLLGNDNEEKARDMLTDPAGSIFGSLFRS